MLQNYIIQLDSIKCLIVICAIVITYAIMNYTRGTYYHEIAHAIAIRKYDKISEIIIAKSYSVFKNNNPKICKKWSTTLYKLLKVRYVIKMYLGKKRSGEIVVCDDFINYKENQIRNIAASGMIGNLVYGIILSLAFSIIFGVLFIITVLVPIIFIIGNFILIPSDRWTDARIILNPKGFKEAIKNKELPVESTYEYYRKTVTQLINIDSHTVMDYELK